MRLSCLGCLGNKKPSKECIVQSRQNEPIEYIVEKQVIKCVPVRLFTTEQDMVSVTPSQPTTVASVVSDKPKSDESYHSTEPKSVSEIDNSEPPKDVAVHTLQDRDEACSAPCAKYILSEEEERQLVSQVLNALASLHTLDAKETVPKDTCPVNPPRRPPDAPVYIPPHLCDRTAKLIQPCQNSEGQPVCRGRSRELTPEQEQAIAALGQAKKPYYCRDIPPKNRKKVAPIITECSDEREFTSIQLAKAAESPVNGEHEDVAYTEEKSSASLVVDNHKSKKPLPNEKDICIMDYSKCSCITRNVQYFDSKNKSQGGHKVGIDETFSFRPQSPKTVAAVPGSTGRHLETVQFEPEGTQITEISQLKGQNLKWRIIIKHQPKDKDQQEIDENTSDSETNIKEYEKNK